MVNAIVNISEKSNRTLNIVKAIYELNDKSQAIDKVVDEYSEKLLEPQFNPEYLAKLNAIEKEPRKKIANVDKFFELDK